MDYLSIAKDFLKAKDYAKAIEAASMANNNNNNWRAFDIIATALFYEQEFESSIRNFEFALKINPEENDIRLKYSWSLYSICKYQQAVDQIKICGVRKEDWQSLKMLGHCHLQTSNYRSAIDAFLKSLLLNRDWLSYYYKGLAHYNLCQDNEAIDAFENSLQEKENWASYRYMAESLARLNQDDKSKLMSFKSLKALKKQKLCETQPNSEDLYSIIAMQYNQLGFKDKASRAMEIHYRNPASDICQVVDPYLGMKPRGITTTREEIIHLQFELKNQGYAFIPSYCSTESSDSQLQQWKNVLHIHIPKCAGTYFEGPLIRLMAALQEASIESSSTQFNLKKYFWHGNMIHQHQMNGYVAGLSNFDDLDNLFLVAHGSNYSQYERKVKSLSRSIRKICLVRNPSARLFSCLRMESRSTEDVGILYQELQKIPYNIFNSMDKYIYSYGLDDNVHEAPYCTPVNYGKINDIEFISVDDELLAQKIKSAFLSANNMPNIVQYNRINEHSQRVNGSMVYLKNSLEVCIAN